MGMFRKPGYQIDRSEPPESFLKARNIAGSRLQEEFNKQKGRVPESRDFKWIKAELTYPSFDHLTFGYGNQVFSVLVDIVSGSQSSITARERDRFIKATSDNNLVPCLFRIILPAMKPASDGWNLIHAITGEEIIPAPGADSESISMSEWEVRNFVIQVVRNHIEHDKGFKVLSFCDVLGIDPQIWFEAKDGVRCWIVVRHLKQPDETAISNWVGLEKTNPQLKDYDGFFAGVFLASSAPVLRDLQGNVIPLSERFSGKAPLYRGDQFHIKFDGLRGIHVSPDAVHVPGQENGSAAYSEFGTGQKPPLAQTSGPCPRRVEPIKLPEDTDPKKLDACRAYARMMNTLDSSHLVPWLADDCQYTSQWVMENIEGKDAYLEYIRGKLNSIKRTDSRVWAEIAYTDAFGAGPCVVLSQDTRDNLTATLLVKMTDGRISQMTMCAIPSPQECRRTGELPA